MVMYRQVFKVRGMGEFPFDMLRYDHCWPAHEGEAGGLNLGVDDAKYFQAREVKLVRDVDDKRREPTNDRWRSFGWVVVPGSVQTTKR